MIRAWIISNKRERSTPKKNVIHIVITWLLSEWPSSSCMLPSASSTEFTAPLLPTSSISHLLSSTSSWPSLSSSVPLALVRLWDVLRLLPIPHMVRDWLHLPHHYPDCHCLPPSQSSLDIVQCLWQPSSPHRLQQQWFRPLLGKLWQPSKYRQLIRRCHEMRTGYRCGFLRHYRQSHTLRLSATFDHRNLCLRTKPTDRSEYWHWSFWKFHHIRLRWSSQFGHGDTISGNGAKTRKR